MVRRDCLCRPYCVALTAAVYMIVLIVVRVGPNCGGGGSLTTVGLLERRAWGAAIEHNVTASTAARCATAMVTGPITRATLTKNWSSRVERQRAPNCDWFIVRSVMGSALRLLGALPSPV